MSKHVIAIDGPAASGKSSVADTLSKRLSIPYVSTGNMYRAITYYLIQHCELKQLSEDALAQQLESIHLKYKQDDDGRMALYLNGDMIEGVIRSPEVSSTVSHVAARPVVRKWLIDQQRDLAALGRIVMEGRDIGTVVFPESNYKFFLTASPQVRAIRRLSQGGEAPEGATIEAVAREIAERDRQDMNRDVAPLKQADDAILVDSSDMTIDEVVNEIINQINNRDENN